MYKTLLKDRGLNKKQVKARYQKIRSRAKTILISRHKKEYFRIIRGLNNFEKKTYRIMKGGIKE
jgi:hypothetical protein